MGSQLKVASKHAENKNKQPQMDTSPVEALSPVSGEEEVLSAFSGGAFSPGKMYREGAYALPEGASAKLGELPYMKVLPEVPRELPRLPSTVSIPGTTLRTQGMYENQREILAISQEILSGAAPGLNGLSQGLQHHYETLTAEGTRGAWLGFQAERGAGEFAPLMSDDNARERVMSAGESFTSAQGEKQQSDAGLVRVAMDIKSTMGQIASALKVKEAQEMKGGAQEIGRQEEDAQRDLAQLEAEAEARNEVIKDIIEVCGGFLSGKPEKVLEVGVKFGQKLAIRGLTALGELGDKELKDGIGDTLKSLEKSRERLEDGSQAALMAAASLDIETLEDHLMALFEHMDDAAEIVETRHTARGLAADALASATGGAADDLNVRKPECFRELDRLGLKLGMSNTALLPQLQTFYEYVVSSGLVEKAQAGRTKDFAELFEAWEVSGQEQALYIALLQQWNGYFTQVEAWGNTLLQNLEGHLQWMMKRGSQDVVAAATAAMLESLRTEGDV